MRNAILCATGLIALFSSGEDRGNCRGEKGYRWNGALECVDPVPGLLSTEGPGQDGRERGWIPVGLSERCWNALWGTDQRLTARPMIHYSANWITTLRQTIFFPRRRRFFHYRHLSILWHTSRFFISSPSRCTRKSRLLPSQKILVRPFIRLQIVKFAYLLGTRSIERNFISFNESKQFSLIER